MKKAKNTQTVPVQTGRTAAAAIVIPQFNQADLTCQCLCSLRDHETCPVEAVVVDDGSSAVSRELLSSRWFPQTRVITQQHAGVSAAWNRGAAATKAPYLVFLNNDTLLAGPVIERLLAPLKRGGALLSGVLMRRETALPPDILRELPTNRFLQGWCFAVSRDNFRRIGGFEESMAVYWSDTDFQARLLREDAADQEKIVCQPELPIRHLGHRTAHRLPQRGRIWNRDRAVFIEKWSSISRVEVWPC